jgi:hypothetical protein
MVLSNLITNSSNNACPYVELMPDKRLSSFSSRYSSLLSLFLTFIKLLYTMSINFENTESRLEYLDEKLDNLLSGINSTYGQALLDELVIRLERTIKDFNEEVEKIMGNLKDNSDRKNKIIHDLMEGNQPIISKKSANKSDNEPENDNDNDDDKPEMSEWEKKLEGL